MGTFFEFQEAVTVVEDQVVRECCFHSQRIRVAAVQSVLSIVGDSSKHPTKEALVAVLILERMAECQLSFEILIARGRERDSAVLLVTILELAFDLIYLDKHPEKVEEWISHKAHGWKPWKIGRLIDDIYDENERGAVRAIYQHCSMVKHGNPAGGHVTLPIGIKNRTIVVPKNKSQPLLTAYVFAAAGNVHRALQSATQIWGRDGHEVEPYLTAADEAWEDLSRLISKRVHEIVAELETSGVTVPQEPDTCDWDI